MSGKKSRITLSRWKDIWDRFSGNGIYPHELAFILDNPLRKFILSPSQFVKNLYIKPGSKVLEIGSRPGYCSTEVSKKFLLVKLFFMIFRLKCLGKV